MLISIQEKKANVSIQVSNVLQRIWQEADSQFFSLNLKQDLAVSV